VLVSMLVACSTHSVRWTAARHYAGASVPARAVACAAAADGQNGARAAGSGDGRDAHMYVDDQLEADSRAADVLLDSVEAWLRDQRVDDVLPEHTFRSLVEAVRQDGAFWERQHTQYERLWARVECQLRRETRPVRSVIGEDAESNLLELADQLDSRSLVRRVLQSRAAERLLGSVLYEALFAFVQSVDILGQLVNALPLIGPMRKQLVDASKLSLDALVGDQIADFLGGYTQRAAQTAVAYVDANGADLARAQRALLEEALQRPFNASLPSELEMGMLRDALWLRVRNFRAPHEDELIARLYEEFGSEHIETLLPAHNPRVRSAVASPPHIFLKGRELLSANLRSFIASEQGRSAIAHLKALDDGEVPVPAAPPAEEFDEDNCPTWPIHSTAADDWD